MAIVFTILLWDLFETKHPLLVGIDTEHGWSSRNLSSKLRVVTRFVFKGDLDIDDDKPLLSCSLSAPRGRMSGLGRDASRSNRLMTSQEEEPSFLPRKTRSKPVTFPDVINVLQERSNTEMDSLFRSRRKNRCFSNSIWHNKTRKYGRDLNSNKDDFVRG